MKTTLSAIFAALILTWVPAAHSDSPPLESLIPDDASMVLVVDDVSAMRAAWPETPFGMLWNDPQVKKFLAPLHDRISIDRWQRDVERETGHSIEQLLGMLSGVAVFVPDLSDVLAKEENGDASGGLDVDQPMFTLIAQLGDNRDTVAKLLTDQAAKGPKSEAGGGVGIERESFREIDLHLIRHQTEDPEKPADRGGWAIVGSLLVAGTPTPQLKAVVGDVLDGGRDRDVTSQATYQLSAMASPGAGAVLTLNLEPFRPSILKALRAGLEGQSAAAMVDPDTLYGALGIEAINGLFMALDLEKAATEIDFGLSVADDEGIVELLAYGPGEAPRPAFIPTDAVGFGSAQFDVGRAWGAVEEIAVAINPALPAMFAMQIAGMAGQSGVEIDLRRDVLENLTGEIVTVEVLPSESAPSDGHPLQLPQAVVLGLEDGLAFENVVNWLIKAASGDGELFATRDHLGVTVNSLKTAQKTDDAEGTEPFSWAVMGDHVVLGFAGAEALEAVLTSKARPQQSPWRTPRVKAALAQLPEGSSAVQYQDLAVTGSLLFGHLATACEMAANDQGAWCDVASLPSPDVVGRYLGPAVSGVYRTNDNLVVRVRILGADGNSRR